MSSCLSITPRAPGFPRNIYTIHPDALEQRGIVTDTRLFRPETEAFEKEF